jgi:hypothetical protein
MNSNRRVLFFVIGSVGLFLILSYLAIFYKFKWSPFERVNLVSEVVKEPVKPNRRISPPPAPKKDSVLIKKDSVMAPVYDFELYNTARLITRFSADTSQSALQKFAEKLHELRSGKKRKIRIAYFGDSMIEGDLISQTLRKELQGSFGGCGVGFVPINSPVAKFRISAYADCSDTWEEENFREGRSNRLFLSGHLFHTSNGWVQVRDQSFINDTVLIEKSLLCGITSNPVTITANNKPFTVRGDQLFNRIVLGKDRGRSVKLAVNNDRLPVYGITFESDSGVFVDNFPFRGVSGIELAKFDSSFLCSIAASNAYDLVVLQYGVNLLFRPNDTEFGWYGEIMTPVIRKIQHCFPNSDLLIVSTADRAFRYDGEYKTAIGMDSLIRTQARVAYETGSAFYNQFASMGGINSIVEWAKLKPPMANRDFIHPNFRGAEILGQYLFEAMMRDYDKYVHSLKQFN